MPREKRCLKQENVQAMGCRRASTIVALGKHQLDQSQVAEVSKHLIDEAPRSARPVCVGAVQIALCQCPDLLAREHSEPPRVINVIAGLPQRIEFLCD